MRAEQELHRVSGAIVTRGRSTATLTATEKAFLAKLRADCWPFVGIGCLMLRLVNGAVYTPDFVTADEGVIVAWSVNTAPYPELLPVVKEPTTYFVSVERGPRGKWIEDDVVPMSDFSELAAGRAAIERIRGRRMSDWDFRDWCIGIEREQRKKHARLTAGAA